MGILKLIAFSRLITAFGRIERTTPFPGTDRLETDIEHTLHLTLMAWYVASSRKLDLDLNMVIKYALAHDLVEVHAGDTCIWSTDAEYVASKHEREAAAAERIAEEFPEFPDLHAAIQEYEKRDTPESRFVYALDKLLPLIMNYEDGGRMWREKGVTIDMLLEKKAAKMAVSPDVEPYLEEILALVRKDGLLSK